MDMAWARSWRAILGHHDWKYHDIFQMINTYKAMADGEPLDWDYAANTTPELKDEKPWRKVAFAAATVCCILTIAYCCQSMRMVPNRGDVNTKEFVENYNTVRNVVYNGGMNIAEDGEWAGVKEQIERTMYGNKSLYDRLGRADDFEDFSFVIGDVELTCDFELQGYTLWQKYYVAREGEDTYYSVRFLAKKVVE